jgi:2Fe-2S ferredoxin
MVELVFVENSGKSHVVEAKPGQSVMRAATGANLPGILAECGGCATCMTCHCFVEPDRLSELPPPGAIEAELLEILFEARPNSRLTCQILVTASMHGMRFDIPAWQG